MLGGGVYASPLFIMIKRFTIKYNFGDFVILKTDPETKRIISGLMFRPGSVTYGLAKGDEETWHQEIEIAPIAKPVKVKGFLKC